MQFKAVAIAIVGLLVAVPASATLAGSIQTIREGERLSSPFGGLTIKVGSKRPGPCPTAPTPFTDALDFPSKYEGSGKSRDTLNPLAEARYKAATHDIQSFEGGLSELSDRYVAGQAEAARCALDWMDTWASAESLLGDANMTGRAVRKWALAAVAFNFLKIQDAPGLDAAHLDHVRGWIARLAHIVIDEHEATPADKINNHYYWAAAAVGAAAIATQQRELLDWAVEGYRTSVKDIDREGVLPREMARRSRALSYHAYALQPLVMLAEIGRVNGVDLYAEGDCALCRLVTRVADGMRDPTFFEERTGVPQVMEDKPDGRSMVWVPILQQACPGDPRLRAMARQYQPFSGRRLGGNLTDVYGHISKELPNAVKSKACGHLWR